MSSGQATYEGRLARGCRYQKRETDDQGIGSTHDVGGLIR